MARRIRLTFVAEAVSALAMLREDDAPETCAALWDALPLVGTAHHAVYSGSEGVLILPDLVTVGPENATAEVVTGDIGFTWFAPGDAYGVTEPFAEICWFYDKDGKPSMPEGPVPVSVFARFVGDTDAFYAVSKRMRREGVKGLAVERVEDGDSPEHAVVFRPRHGSAIDPHAVRLTDGTILVAFTHCAGGPKPDPRCLPVFCRSDDHGKTWSLPAPIEGFQNVGYRLAGLAGGGGVLTILLEQVETGKRIQQELPAWQFGRQPGSDAPAAAFRSTPPPEVAFLREGKRPAQLALGGDERRTLRVLPAARSAYEWPGFVETADDHLLVVYDAFDGFPDASVPGVCGIHATRVPSSFVREDVR